MCRDLMRKLSKVTPEQLGYREKGESLLLCLFRVEGFFFSCSLSVWVGVFWFSSHIPVTYASQVETESCTKIWMFKGISLPALKWQLSTSVLWAMGFFKVVIHVGFIIILMCKGCLSFQFHRIYFYILYFCKTGHFTVFHVSLKLWIKVKGMVISSPNHNSVLISAMY